MIVPTLNEAENVELLIRRVSAALPDAEIIIVDDASTDDTVRRARALAGAYPVRVIERSGERDLSTAVLEGVSAARARVCAVMDADFSHPPEMLPALVERISQGSKIAVGSRHVEGGEIHSWPLRRRLTSRMGTWLARPLTSARDPLSGFFCFRRDLLSGVTLKPKGYKILLEILARSATRDIAELPIRFTDRSKGRSKFGPRQRRQYLRQVWTLYRETRAWPWKVTGALVALVSAAAVALSLSRFASQPILVGLSALVGALTAAFWFRSSFR